MDLIPMPDGARPLIKGYGDGGFRVGTTRIEGAIVVTEDGASALPVATLADCTEALARDIAAGQPEILLLGTGADMQPPPHAFADALRDAGIGIEAMATGPACRTFNVLLGDGRAVAALLLPVS